VETAAVVAYASFCKMPSGHKIEKYKKVEYSLKGKATQIGVSSSLV
jgi:hypothetical protein